MTPIHGHLRRQRRPYRVVFVAEPVCWTEVPGSCSVLARQRRRWSRGLAEVLVKHRRMVANPRYGRIGLVVLPYYVVFELLSPLVELFGVVTVALALSLGILNLSFALLFALGAVGYGILLSIAALAVEEFSFHRYPRWSDLALAAAAAVVENLGYRQLHALWRLNGLLDAARRRRTSWGVMTRVGFTAPAGS